MEVNIHHAKTHLSGLLQKVALREEVIIAKAGKPIAKIVPLPNKAGKRMPGSAKGAFVVPDDFNAPLPMEIEGTFWK